ncbi:MAG TPA: UbiX family flavin prenyltransferase [Sedimenticola sp.]|nr:UbiX family flavin prenyltransferase [Sedimenticola sp.]
MVDASPERERAVGLALTGASGTLYGLRLLECLLGAGRPVRLMISRAARVVAALESEITLPADTAECQRLLSRRFRAAAGQLVVYGQAQWTAPLASGSGAPGAMVICPCSTGTLSAVANGASDNLIERAADVMLKEQRKLILVIRETPLSAIHLENMLRLARLGVVVMPASPGFYQHPLEIGQLVDHLVARILDHLEVPHRLSPRWGGE